MNVETVRYYQRRRLLAVPAKRAQGFRHYGRETLERLRFIRRAQALGLSLEDIRQLLGLDRKRACVTTRALAAQRLALIETKLKDLRFCATRVLTFDGPMLADEYDSLRSSRQGALRGSLAAEPE